MKTKILISLHTFLGRVYSSVTAVPIVWSVHFAIVCLIGSQLTVCCIWVPVPNLDTSVCTCACLNGWHKLNGECAWAVSHSDKSTLKIIWKSEWIAEYAVGSQSHVGMGVARQECSLAVASIPVQQLDLHCEQSPQDFPVSHLALLASFSLLQNKQKTLCTSCLHHFRTHHPYPQKYGLRQGC